MFLSTKPAQHWIVSTLLCMIFIHYVCLPWRWDTSNNVRPQKYIIWGTVKSLDQHTKDKFLVLIIHLPWRFELRVMIQADAPILLLKEIKSVSLTVKTQRHPHHQPHTQLSSSTEHSASMLNALKLIKEQCSGLYEKNGKHIYQIHCAAFE